MNRTTAVETVKSIGVAFQLLERPDEAAVETRKRDDEEEFVVRVPEISRVS